VRYFWAPPVAFLLEITPTGNPSLLIAKLLKLLLFCDNNERRGVDDRLSVEIQSYGFGGAMLSAWSMRWTTVVAVQRQQRNPHYKVLALLAADSWLHPNRRCAWPKFLSIR
jgi:hypothetical protein